MKKQLTFLFLTLTITVFGQVEQNKNPSDFIPKGYVIHKYEGGISSGSWDEIKGDLNKANFSELAFLLPKILSLKNSAPLEGWVFLPGKSRGGYFQVVLRKDSVGSGVILFCSISERPRIGDSGGLESRNFQFCTNLSNSFFIFTKIIKKEI